MKITQLFKIYWPDNGGGIARIMENIADVFAGSRQEMIVCQDQRRKKSADDSYKGIPVHRCRQLFEIASTPVSPQFLFEVKKRTKDSDVVVYHFPYPMADLAILFGMYKGRLVVWWHCGFEQNKKLALLYGPLVRHTLKKADRIFVSSKENLKNSRLLLEYQKKCRVIPFCVSNEYLQKGMEHMMRPSEKKEQIIILFVGRLVWYKGCDILLRAFAAMDSQNCRLVIVGGGPLEEKLKRQAAAGNLCNVTFTGRISEEEKMDWLKACDFLVLPSISKAEAFAVVQLETMAFGKPVINTALSSGVPSVSIDGVTGLTVKPGSVRQLAAAMQKLVDNEKLRKTYGENAARRVRERYTMKVMADKHKKAFQQLLNDNTQEPERKIAFDGQLFLGGDKTGIAWNAHHLLLELLKYPENAYTLQCFKGRKAAGQMYRLEEYRKAGCAIECCKRLGYTMYKLLWTVVPIPHRLFFRTKADLTIFFNYVIPPGVRGKRIAFVYDMSYRACPQTLSRKTRIWLQKNMKQTCRRADGIITISEFSKSEIMKYLKVPPEHIHIVPCAVDHNVYHPDYTKEQIQKALDKYGIQQEYLLYLGTIEPRKNLERLIGAYELLCRRQNQAPQLVLAGKKGWKCSGIYEKARKLEEEGRVLFTGYVQPKDSPLLMCGAEAFVFPSLYEGFGMPPLEAMACGTTVITSKTTSLREVAAGAAVTVNPASEEEICQAMRKVLYDEAFRKRLERLGIQRAGEFTWEKSARKLVEICRLYDQ